jgi:EAL domain-containing protein (putative c-di-GMP-specific phosphodiesterase class I)
MPSVFQCGWAQAHRLAAIVKVLIGLASDLRMSATAEGIEDAEQLIQLRIMNCSEGQGNYIGVPKTAEEIAEIFGTGSSTGRLRLVSA